MEALSKGKLDKHDQESYEELEDDFFDDAFELVFDEAFHRAASASPTPSHEQTKNMQESWLKVQTEINRIGKRRKRKQTFWLSGVVAASVTLGALLFSVPAGTQAVSPFVQTIKDWGNGMKSIVIKDGTEKMLGADPSTAKTPPPPNPGIEDAPKVFSEETVEQASEFERDFTQTLVPVKVTEEEARSGFNGDFLLSKAIPERFNNIKFELMLDIDGARPLDSDFESDQLRVLYTIESTNVQDEIIQFDFIWIHPGQVIENPVLRETTTVTLKDGSDAFFSTGPTYNTFQWMMGSTNVSIYGTVSKTELLAIANDLQKQKFHFNN